MDFEGRHHIARVSLSTDFESAQKYGVVNILVHEADAPEGHDHLDVLAGITSSESSGVELVISSFKVFTIFSDEGERQPVPVSVAPLGTNEEGNGSQTVTLDWLYREEQVVGGSGVEIMDGCINLKRTYGHVGHGCEGVGH